MQCKNRYYEADTGYMCWLNKKECSESNCTLRYRFVEDFTKKVMKELKNDKSSNQ